MELHTHDTPTPPHKLAVREVVHLVALHPSKLLVAVLEQSRLTLHDVEEERVVAEMPYPRACKVWSMDLSGRSDVLALNKERSISLLGYQEGRMYLRCWWGGAGKGIVKCHPHVDDEVFLTTDTQVHLFMPTRDNMLNSKDVRCLTNADVMEEIDRRNAQSSSFEAICLQRTFHPVFRIYCDGNYVELVPSGDKLAFLSVNRTATSLFTTKGVATYHANEMLSLRGVGNPDPVYVRRPWHVGLVRGELWGVSISPSELTLAPIEGFPPPCLHTKVTRLQEQGASELTAYFYPWRCEGGNMWLRAKGIVMYLCAALILAYIVVFPFAQDHPGRTAVLVCTYILAPAMMFSLRTAYTLSKTHAEQAATWFIIPFPKKVFLPTRKRYLIAVACLCMVTIPLVPWQAAYAVVFVVAAMGLMVLCRIVMVVRSMLSDSPSVQAIHHDPIFVDLERTTLQPHSWMCPVFLRAHPYFRATALAFLRTQRVLGNGGVPNDLRLEVLSYLSPETSWELWRRYLLLALAPPQGGTSPV